MKIEFCCVKFYEKLVSEKEPIIINAYPDAIVYFSGFGEWDKDCPFCGKKIQVDIKEVG